MKKNYITLSILAVVLVGCGCFLNTNWNHASQERAEEWEASRVLLPEGNVDSPDETGWIQIPLSKYSTWSVWRPDNRGVGGRCALEKADGSPGVWSTDSGSIPPIGDMTSSMAFKEGDNALATDDSGTLVRIACTTGSAGPIYVAPLPRHPMAFFVAQPGVIPIAIVFALAGLSFLTVGIVTLVRLSRRRTDSFNL